MSTSSRLNLQSAALATLALLLYAATSLRAQGVLTITPGRMASTIAGSGTPGYAGDNGTATLAALASPSAVVYDSAGNLFLADANNHVVREVSKSGIITTVAGTGIAGFGGDGSSATAAFLDTPTGVAVDANSNLYIADSHNQRIRMVSGGIIHTVAGTGNLGFSGDGGSATAATLALPSAIAVDQQGNLYIADTNNQRIRKVSGGTITTIAGDGEELYAGDGGAATAASLDLPTGVAVDPGGKVYIADRHNQRVRVVDGSGTISTLAGSGPITFSGGFAGDGATSASAALAKPFAVSVDASGNVYIADSGNQRIRQVGGGSIVTVAGNGSQGFDGDGGIATSAILNQPKAVVSDASGNLIIADTLNQRIRSATLPTLSFSSPSSGNGAPQSVTLANTGSASIAISTATFAGPFVAATGGNCSTLPFTLAAGASCTQNISFLPNISGTVNGSVVFGGPGVVPQSILLSGSAVSSSTTTTLTTNNAVQFAGQPIVFTATVKPLSLGTLTGAITFYDGSNSIGSVQTPASGIVSITIYALADGPHSITAVYAGNPNFTGSTSAPLVEMLEDFNVASASNSTGSINQTVIPGQAATYAFTVQPLVGSFGFPVTVSATGMPPGATVTFTPQVVTPGAGAVGFTMSIQTATSNSSLPSKPIFGTRSMVFASLLLPWTICLRRRTRRRHPLFFGVVLSLGLAVLGAISGCGNGTGFFAQPQQSYSINVIGAASGSNGAVLQHSSIVTLTVQ